jgi:uncharacterized protein YdeI (YjbR/CyaY-like superfamily)
MNSKQSIPADVRAGLAMMKGAQKAFLALPSSHQKEYLQWISSAKRSETRERRIRQAAEMVLKKSGR